ncbi:uncharacterized protein LOC129569341 [Sitodiplosis mosellana]|uniref:uncharacterized protein LOC129569341 n=1 Tax=Sitodiplosis mosellana TaxID=263140 RepID=UPI0024438A2C|nr:uncharacterized protein LOC129569341 [Sitodiplosis mosellana]
MMIKFVLLCSLTLWSSEGVFGVDSIKGTFFADKAENGGCQMPIASYRITDAIALGQETNLGPLIWRQGLCGQVFDIDCGHGMVSAVVVDTCNLNTKNCGIDMIKKTWDKATGNQPPDVVKCKVTLSKANPLNDKEMVCYHRPDSDIGNEYFVMVGVLNTNGRIPKSADIDGRPITRQNNDAWFVFSSGGKPLFHDSAVVKFTFEDGGSVKFKLSDCKNGGDSVQVFQ